MRNFNSYYMLPYNPKLKERACELRKQGNISEIIFWRRVKNGLFKGYDFDRQKIIGNYIVDFYCVNCGVVIEIDGSSHDGKEEYDAQRDGFLRSLNLNIIHINADDVLYHINDVMVMLQNHPAFQETR